MSHRIDIELTSAHDGVWTWRAAGAKQPKGTLAPGMLYDGAQVGDVVRAEAERELEGTRIARPRLLVSFHHPASLHHLSRALRRLVTGRRGDRHAITLGRLKREALEHGLRFVRAKALSPGLRDLWVALFEREEAPRSAPAGQRQG